MYERMLDKQNKPTEAEFTAHCGKQEITLHYTIHTETTDPCAQDLAGRFHIVSMWKKTGDTWNLFFNMDCRIAQA